MESETDYLYDKMMKWKLMAYPLACLGSHHLSRTETTQTLVPEREQNLPSLQRVISDKTVDFVPSNCLC